MTPRERAKDVFDSLTRIISDEDSSPHEKASLTFHKIERSIIAAISEEREECANDLQTYSEEIRSRPGYRYREAFADVVLRCVNQIRARANK